MNTESIVILSIFIGFSLLEMAFGNFLRQPEERPNDRAIDVVAMLLPALFTKPFIFASAFAAMNYLFPDTKESLAAISIPVGLLILIFADDLVQYWQHRLIHTVPGFYNLHRVHHQACYMSVRMSARAGFFHLLLMPNYWIVGALVYMGLGLPYIIYMLTKFTLGLSAHSNVRWDTPLYKIKWLSPLMYVLERVIVTPAFHAAHHGKHKEDGVTNYKGNFGALLSIWDVIFGTARITRKVPREFGIENLAPMSPASQMFWPLIWSPPPLDIPQD